MDCNKDEAIRAKEIAEKKMERNDFEGARKIAKKAQSFYPELENISQLLTVCDVHCSSLKKVLGSEKDWYEILQVERLADELTVKKQYRRLALFLHPDKNRFPGAEAAFKLICEANAVLSDPAKKSLYDSKIRVSVRSAPAYKPIPNMNKNPQCNNYQRVQSCVSNAFSSENLQQAAGSSSSFSQVVFWTFCPFCNTRYQYKREYVNISMRCLKCSKIFMACEISAQNNSMGSKCGQHGTQPMPSKSGLNIPVSVNKKGVSSEVNLNKDVKNSIGVSESHAQVNSSKNSVQQGQDIKTGSGSGYSMASGTSNGETVPREKRNLKNKGWKRERKRVIESSESFDNSIESDIEDVTTGANVNETDSEFNTVHFPRRSTRKRQHVIYNESDDDFASPPVGSHARKFPEDGRKDQKDDLGGEDSFHGSENSFSADACYSKSKGRQMGTVHPEGSFQEKGTDDDKEVNVIRETGGMPCPDADTIEIKSDSDQDLCSSDNSDADKYDCPEPEFCNFDENRDESCFSVDQIWACYGDLDSMPRFYAKVKKICKSPFNLCFTWLEADPKDKAGKKGVDGQLPIGCGSFKLGKTENTSHRLTFSHQMCGEKGLKRGSFIIYPREGETWAIFKDWDISSSSEPSNHQFKYEIVEVLSDFDPGVGIKVISLDKITGFVSIFQRTSRSENESFLIGPNDLYKFSHRVPCYKITGFEREGVPRGSFELDPAALPLNPDDLYYPGKAKMEHGNLDPKDNVQQSQHR